MVLRRAVDRLKQQRTLRLALRAALAVAAVSTSTITTNAQEAGLTLPPLPSLPSATQGALPSLYIPEANSSHSKHVAKMFGFANRSAPVAFTQGQSSAKPSERQTPAVVSAGQAEISWTTRRQPTGRASWVVNPHVTPASANVDSSVVPAAASAPADDTKTGNQAITMTISGRDDERSFLDVDIPLMLPSHGPADQAESTQSEVVQERVVEQQARTPEIITQKTQIRLSGRAKVEQAVQQPAARQSTLATPKMQVIASRPEQVEFSLSDAAPAKSIPAPTSVPTLPDVKDAVPSDVPEYPLPPPAPYKASVPELPAASEPTPPAELADLKPASKMVAVPQGLAKLPSTTSSRASAVGHMSENSQTAREPMQVLIEGQPARVVRSEDAKSIGQTPRPPQATFETSRDSVENRYEFGAKQSLPTPRPVRAHLASQRDSAPTSYTISQGNSAEEEVLNREDFASSRKSEKARRIPAEALGAMAEISVTVEQAAPLSVRNAIVQTSVEDPSVCQLIQSGERSLSLVGLKAGTTRVAIVTSSNGSEPKVRVYQVSVGRGAKAEFGLTELAGGIDETISRLYPSSRIRVRAGEGQLIVSGIASSEEEARKVLALVRRTSLMPVTDKLQAR